MRTDDPSASLDRFDDEGDEIEVLGLEVSGADPLEVVDDPDAEPDEELLAAEQGDQDILDDAIGADEEIEDPGDAEDDDDLEMALLQDLGIDLDAPDGPVAALDALLADDELANEDEVAA